MASNLRVDSIVPATGSSVSIGTATGGVNIPGVLTYEDVTNIDSIGIITARSGIRIAAGSTVGPVSGIVTYFGDGSQLTGITAGTSLSGSTNNTVCTVTGANAIQGEATLTFDGTNLTSTVSGNSGIVVAASGNNAPQIKGQANRSALGNTLLSIHGVWNGTDVAMIDLQAGADTTNKDDGQISFYTTPSGGSMAERLKISSEGYVTMPSRPYFKANKSAVISSGGYVTFNTVIYNNGSHYNNSDGKFTAPIDGLYWFSCKINAYDRLDFQLRKNGTRFEYGQYNTDNDQVGWWSNQLTSIVEMTAGQYVQVYVSHLDQNTDPGEWLTFMGYLLS